MFVHFLSGKGLLVVFVTERQISDDSTTTTLISTLNFQKKAFSKQVNATFAATKPFV